MMRWLRGLLRSLLTIAALVFGALMAALVTVLTLATGLVIGAALWLAARFGLRGPPSPGRPAPGSDRDVIDVEMREVGPGAPPDRPGTPEDGKHTDR